MHSDIEIHCPFCHRATAASPPPLAVLWGGQQRQLAEFLKGYDDLGTPYYVYDGQWWLAKCNACKRALLIQDDGSRVYPTPRPGPTHEGIPDPMRTDLIEAKVCLTANAYRACATMARRSLQCACVAQGAPTKTMKGGFVPLAKQINDLEERRIITPSLCRMAHAIRLIGNDGAHAEEEEVFGTVADEKAVTMEDAAEIMELAEFFLHTIYGVPKIGQNQLEKRGG